MVHSQSTLDKTDKQNKSEITSPIENEQELDNELTPGSSSTESSTTSSSSSSLSSSSSNSPDLNNIRTANDQIRSNLNFINSDLNNIYKQQQDKLKRLNQEKSLSPKEQLSLINSNLIK